MTEYSHNRILDACYGFLVPVVRTLLRVGVSYRELDELVRLAYVRVASDEFGLRGRPTNHSRISAMTGIPRKEVSRIQSEPREACGVTRQELSPLGDVLQRWHTDSLFLDSEGRPLRLPLTGLTPCFEDLVRSCSSDLPIGALKVELLRIGAAKQDTAGNLYAVRREVVPDALDDRLISSLSFNLTCLASTISHNSDPGRTGEGRIERFVESEQLSELAKQSARKTARERIERFTIEIDDLFSALDDGNNNPSGRIGVGVYYFEDD
jgi:hypothetical protein